MASATIVKIEDAPVFQRGDGVLTTLLVGKGNAAGTVFTSGLTRFPPGRSAPLHSHNCGEQVILLEGEGEVEVDGEITRLKRYDTTYFPGDTPHRFYASVAAPMLNMWMYGSYLVTRSFSACG
jgi:quercetin dioxygenase-like cupin family protein